MAKYNDADKILKLIKAYNKQNIINAANTKIIVIIKSL